MFKLIFNRIFKRETDQDVQDKVIFTLLVLAFVLLFAILFIVHWITGTEFRTVNYPVEEITSSVSATESTTIYVSTMNFKGIKTDDFPHIYYFRERRQKKVDIFLCPQYLNGKVISERYVNVFHSSHYTAAKGAAVYNAMFKLADKTSEENPLMLLEKNGILYGFINETAYVLADNYLEVPEEINIGKIRNIKKKYTLKLRYDGEYEELLVEDESTIGKVKEIGTGKKQYIPKDKASNKKTKKK